MSETKPEPMRCKACGCGFDDITPLCNGQAVLHTWVPRSEYARQQLGHMGGIGDLFEGLFRAAGKR